MRTIFPYTLVLLLCTAVASLTAQDLSPRLRLASDLPAELAARLTVALQPYVQLDTTSGPILQATLIEDQAMTLDGIRTKEVIGYQLLLEVTYRGEAQVIATGSVPLKGTGSSKAGAQQQALREIRATNTNLKQWAGRYAKDYQSYFGEHCHRILAGAADHAGRGEWLIALGLVEYLPPDSPCAGEAAALRTEYYQNYQQTHCRDHQHQAELALTQQQARAAIDHLALIDPGSPCADEVPALLNQATRMLQTQETAKAAFLRQVYQNQVQIETARNQIISDLVKED
jgi:hypothetical protein